MKRILMIVLVLGGTAHAQDSAAQERAPGPVCGNGIVEPGEECDDGNTIDGDGCSSKCQREAAEDPSEHFNFFSHPLDYRKYDEWGGPLGDGKMEDKETRKEVHEEEPMSAPFVFALVNFGLLLLLLAKYLVPAGRKVAVERHDQIKTALDEAAKLRDEAKRKLADYEARIANVDAEIEKLVAGIRADAEADKKRILEAAETQAEQMKRDADQRIAAEIELARARLAQEVSSAASAAAAKLVRERATADDQKRLVSNFISGLGGP
jgi:F-type H+-transporting ATPase subunit b